jgi:hypothetical protein
MEDYKPLVAIWRPRKPRRKCHNLEFEVYDDKSGYEITGTTNNVMPPTTKGRGSKKLREIANWLNEIADWNEIPRP